MKTEDSMNTRLSRQKTVQNRRQCEDNAQYEDRRQYEEDCEDSAGQKTNSTVQYNTVFLTV